MDRPALMTEMRSISGPCSAARPASARRLATSRSRPGSAEAGQSCAATTPSTSPGSQGRYVGTKEVEREVDIGPQRGSALQNAGIATSASDAAAHAAHLPLANDGGIFVISVRALADNSGEVLRGPRTWRRRGSARGPGRGFLQKPSASA